MSKPHMRSPGRVDHVDPAAVVAWAGLARGRVDDLKPMVLDATEAAGHRKMSRHFLRDGMLRVVRDLHLLLDVLMPRSGPPDASQDAAPGAPCVLGYEEQRGDSWHRWIEISFLVNRTVYTYRADGAALTFEYGADVQAAIGSPDFAPCVPEGVTARAVEACRAVALRLAAEGVTRRTITRAWNEGEFAAMVRGKVG